MNLVIYMFFRMFYINLFLRFSVIGRRNIVFLNNLLVLLLFFWLIILFLNIDIFIILVYSFSVCVFRCNFMHKFIFFWRNLVISLDSISVRTLFSWIVNNLGPLRSNSAGTLFINMNTLICWQVILFVLHLNKMVNYLKLE